MRDSEIIEKLETNAYKRLTKEKRKTYLILSVSIILLIISSWALFYMIACGV